MQTLKITHFFILHNEEDKPFSGAENHLWDLLKGLSESCDVELLVSLGIVGPFINSKLDELKMCGVIVTPIYRSKNASKNKYIKILKECILYFKAFKIRKDRILHLHLNTNVVPITAILAKHPNIFYSFHNDLPELTNFFNRKLLKFLIGKFKHTIAITNHVKHFLTQFVKLPSDKISVIHYGINPPILVDTKMIKIPDTNGRLVIGFVGRLHDEQKNIFFLLDCLAEIENSFLLIFGDGPDRARLDNRIKELNMQNRVFIYGYLNHASSYMKLFDFLCLPSKWEGLGLVLIEAMYQKVPIIGSSGGAIPEILLNGELGTIIDPYDKESTVKKMKLVFQNISEANSIALKAFEYANENYSIEKMTDKTIGIYYSNSN